jgi:hypothetical protein
LLSFDVKTYVLSCENLCAMMLILLEIKFKFEPTFKFEPISNIFGVHLFVL